MAKKKLTDVIGELYTPQCQGEKDFVAKHKIKKIKDLEPSTKDDKLFQATNIGKAPMKHDATEPGPAVAEGYYGDTVAGYPANDPMAQRNAMIQQQMNLAQRYNGQSATHDNMADQHNQLGADMNTDPALRKMHSNIAGLHDKMSDAYSNLSQYHDGQMTSAITGDCQ